MADFVPITEISCANAGGIVICRPMVRPAAAITQCCSERRCFIGFVPTLTYHVAPQPGAHDRLYGPLLLGCPLDPRGTRQTSARAPSLYGKLMARRECLQHLAIAL